MGPAAAISIMSRRGRLRYRESTGTGLAQPKPMRTMASAPMGSRWAMGFKVSRPWSRAVGSPSRLASQPCANS